jgi:hypothetical protein
MGIAERHRFERSTLEGLDIAAILKCHREKGIGQPYPARLYRPSLELPGFIVRLGECFQSVWTIGRAVYEMTRFHGDLLRGQARCARGKVTCLVPAAAVPSRRSILERATSVMTNWGRPIPRS